MTMMDKQEQGQVDKGGKEGISLSLTVPTLKGSGMFRIPVSEKWALAGKTQVKIRSSRITLCILGLLITLVATGVVLNYRIHKVESKNLALEGELQHLNLKLICLMVKMSGTGKSLQSTKDDDSGYCNEFQEEWALLADQDQDQEGETEDKSVKNQRARRSLEYQNGNGGSDNGRSDVDIKTNPLSSLLNLSWNASSGTSPLKTVALKDNHRKRERGTKSKSSLRNQYYRLKHLNEKDQAHIAKLKIKLETAQHRANTAKNLLTAYRQREIDQNTTEARAVYLTVRDSNINILNPKQLIGPWHMADSGADLGFNDLWYQNLSLDDNGTSVMFQENGLYLIYAQVYYKSTQTKKDKIAPMGFKIYLKKNNKSTSTFQRPIPIAECVPAFPKTYYQTCFTQICWFIEEGDEVFLEHFTEATPIIEAENMGQTFLGIVRLSR